MKENTLRQNPITAELASEATSSASEMDELTSFFSKGELFYSLIDHLDIKDLSSIRKISAKLKKIVDGYISSYPEKTYETLLKKIDFNKPSLSLLKALPSWAPIKNILTSPHFANAFFQRYLTSPNIPNDIKKFTDLYDFPLHFSYPKKNEIYQKNVAQWQERSVGGAVFIICSPQEKIFKGYLKKANGEIDIKNLNLSPLFYNRIYNRMIVYTEDDTRSEISDDEFFTVLDQDKIKKLKNLLNQLNPFGENEIQNQLLLQRKAQFDEMLKNNGIKLDFDAIFSIYNQSHGYMNDFFYDTGANTLIPEQHMNIEGNADSPWGQSSQELDTLHKKILFLNTFFNVRFSLLEHNHTYDSQHTDQLEDPRLEIHDPISLMMAIEAECREYKKITLGYFVMDLIRNLLIVSVISGTIEMIVAVVEPYGEKYNPNLYLIGLLPILTLIPITASRIKRTILARKNLLSTYKTDPNQHTLFKYCPKKIDCDEGVKTLQQNIPEDPAALTNGKEFELEEIVIHHPSTHLSSDDIEEEPTLAEKFSRSPHSSPTIFTRAWTSVVDDEEKRPLLPKENNVIAIRGRFEEDQIEEREVIDYTNTPAL